MFSACPFYNDKTVVILCHMLAFCFTGRLMLTEQNLPLPLPPDILSKILILYVVCLLL
jgi:hypothetical protein